MTTRLYYTDSLLRTFQATVVSCEAAGDRTEVVLDQTAFYPTSGGQPFDTGTLGAARVLDVVDRDDDVIVHIVDGRLPVGERATGAIDWPRRFDHMQQHTGQHILSAAFDRGVGARTVSFHLGTDSATIDLARDLGRQDVAAAEAEANRVVWDDVPVSIRFASDEEAARLPLRKDPARTGLLRLVEVEQFDLSACGGTHVPRTGMIGLIAITGWERFKGGTRVTFVCGGRALRSHGHLRDVVADSTRLLSVGAADVPSTIERLQGEMKSASRTLRQLHEEAARYRAIDLRSQAETINAHRCVLRKESGLDAGGLKGLAAAIVSEPGLVAVLTGDGQPTPVAIARSADVALDAGGWMKQAVQALGGRGGGRPEQAQGGLSAPADDVLAFARRTL